MSDLPGNPPLPARYLSDSASVASPCVRNCCLDQQDICLGCGRSLQEILRWGKASRCERLEILERVAQRIGLAHKADR